MNGIVGHLVNSECDMGVPGLGKRPLRLLGVAVACVVRTVSLSVGDMDSNFLTSQAYFQMVLEKSER